MGRKFFTVPNALTLLRALTLPFFAYFALGRHHNGAAILLLMFGGASDYFDGKLARAWNQQSRLGELMDPTVDRLFIATTLIVLYVKEIIPIWVILLLVGRDLLLGLLTLAMQRAGHGPFSVTYLGKAATFNLLYAFPFLLVAQWHSGWGDAGFVLGWSFAVWGIALYIFTGFDYFRLGWRLLSTTK
ncbi:MAG TPA: CDP-alcohol phosphatidyltransferase family protein [Candidatus Nanopelagicaceae bacterium]